MDWNNFCAALENDYLLCDTYEKYLRQRSMAASEGTVLRPFVAIPVMFAAWEEWYQENDDAVNSIGAFANVLFSRRVRELVLEARDFSVASILPSRYIMTTTEVIGQDRANDVSHIASVRERLHDRPALQVLVQNQRIFHEHALALAAAYAVRDNAECVMWQLEKRYAWV